MLIIGVTGGSGCGKSTVSELFCELGAETIDADTVYHDLLNNSDALMRELKKRFPEAVTSTSRLDRRRLAEIVFSDSTALADLNTIAHKFVLEDIERRISEFYRRNAQYLCIDAIALFESGLSSMCDVTVGVLAPRDARISRIISRDGIDTMAAGARINAQPADDFYIDKCDYIIMNDGDIENVKTEVTNVFSLITKG